MLVTSNSFCEIQAEHWTTLPSRLQRIDHDNEWVIANQKGRASGSFLEGPELCADGTLYCVDIPHGRVLSVSPEGTWELVAEYDGWPNGLKMDAEGNLVIADYKNGIVMLDRTTGRHALALTHRHSQRFLGLNDLYISPDGAIWFTDQGQTGLQDASGRVYRWEKSGKLSCVLEGLPSPNGLRVSPDSRELYVAVTRDNSVWRAPLMHTGVASKVGRFASFYGPTRPDGLHLDSSRRLWVCLPGADSIWIMNAKGETAARVRFPDGAFPTNLVLDREEKRAYVTCSGTQSIFTVRVP